MDNQEKLARLHYLIQVVMDISSCNGAGEHMTQKTKEKQEDKTQP
jgi:hypothetical protein